MRFLIQKEEGVVRKEKAQRAFKNLTAALRFHFTQPSADQFSVSIGDGGNPSPLGEAKIV